MDANHLCDKISLEEENVLLAKIYLVNNWIMNFKYIFMLKSHGKTSFDYRFQLKVSIGIAWFIYLHSKYKLI